MNLLVHQNRRARQIAFALLWLGMTMKGGGYVLAQVVSSSAARDAAVVQPFITETTFLIVKVEPERIALPKQFDPVGRQPGYDVWAQRMAKGFDSLRAATEGHVTYATIGIPESASEWSSFLFLKEISAQSQMQLMELLGAFRQTQASTRNGLTILMPAQDQDVATRLKAIILAPREELTEAFDAVKDYPIQILLLPPEHIRRTVAELMPTLPRQLASGPSRLLTDGLVWASLGIDIAGPRVSLVVQSSSSKAAQDLAMHLPKMMHAAYRELPDVNKTIPLESFRSLMTLIKPSIKGDRITIQLMDPQSIDGVLQLVASAQGTVGEKMRQQKTRDKFRNILLGFHNYHDVYKSFPPRKEDRNAQGKSGLSWRVHILPFVGEQKLYGEFALDEPWDSPQNKPLIEKIPKIYESLGGATMPGHTTFLAPVGKDTIFGGQKPTSFHHVIDGISNTVTLVEVKPNLSVPWTAPRDYTFDTDTPGNGLRVADDGSFLAAFADGSVQRLQGNIAAELMRQLFLMNDRTPFNWADVRAN